jgi:hypothetical protein
MRGTTMDNPGCEWIRGRLPLWIGDGDGSDDDGGDLSVQDRRTIEGHLRECPRCREHQAGLARALEALTVTAGVPPMAPDEPSLWPSLERRIAGHHRGDDSWMPRVGGPVAGGSRVRPALDDERPLRSAWMRDSLREVVEAAGLGVLSDPSEGARHGRSGRSPRVMGGGWRIVGASLAASVLALVVVLPTAWRRQAAAEANILANAAPAANSVGPPTPDEPVVAEVKDPTPRAHRHIPTDQLAQAEPIRPPAEPPSAADAKAGPRPEPPVQFDYDLDHGTPMPPDGRDAKPVY